MKDNLILEGKTYISARLAAKLMNYAQDYVGQLCRLGKVDAKMVGRSWFVTTESLFAYRASAVEATEERVENTVNEIKQQAQEKRTSVKLGTQKSWSKTTPVVPLLNGTVKVSLADGAAEIISQKKEEIKKSSLKDEIKKIIGTKSFDAASASGNNLGANDTLFKYEAIKSPMMPELEKKVPTHFSMSRPTSGPAVVRFDSRKPFSINTAVIIILIGTTILGGSLFTASLFSYNKTIGAVPYQAVGSAFSATGKFAFDIGQRLTNGMTRIGELITAPVGSPVAVSDVTPAAATANVSSSQTTPATDGQELVSLNGMAVAPSANSKNTDETLKQKIKNTFSDNVDVQADTSGVSGVIKPVFKNADGDNFVYVLVPVKDEKDTKTPAKATQN